MTNAINPDRASCKGQLKSQAPPPNSRNKLPWEEIAGCIANGDTQLLKQFSENDLECVVGHVREIRRQRLQSIVVKAIAIDIVELDDNKPPRAGTR